MKSCNYDMKDKDPTIMIAPLAYNKSNVCITKIGKLLETSNRWNKLVASNITATSISAHQSLCSKTLSKVNEIYMNNDRSEILID